MLSEKRSYHIDEYNSVDLRGDFMSYNLIYIQIMKYF